MQNKINKNVSKKVVEIDLQELEQKPEFKVGKFAQEVDWCDTMIWGFQEVRKLFPNFELLTPQGKPGVYVIYFEPSKTIYLGESSKVSFEIARIRTIVA
jgi:hypothetical protein